MDVNIPVFVKVRFDAEGGGATAYDAHSRLNGLLHHITQLTGDHVLALAWHHRSLDAQQLAADFGPG